MMRKLMFVFMVALTIVSCTSRETKNVPTSDSTKVVLNVDSVQVADSSVMVLDSTVGKIGKK
jgi:uncharacterized protein YcfL